MASGQKNVMKKIIVFAFLLFSVNAFAQKDVLNDTLVKPVITEIGKPDGEKVNLIIGEEGGRLKSSDGKVELVFPAGALTENTNIIIQPVINLAPNGSGKSYWFEPSGIQFKKPVQIIFHYTDEQAEICPPDLMGLAIQNKEGKWSFTDYDSWDSTARSLKGSIIHFSGASNVNKMMLVPNVSNIQVGDELEMWVMDIRDRFEYKGWDIFFFDETEEKNITTRWYVNNIFEGDREVGYVRDNGHFERLISAKYYAPRILPNKNPVTIKVEYYMFKKGAGGKTFKLIKTLTSKIYVYDVYNVTIICHIKAAAGSQLGNVTYKDTGSFVVLVQLGYKGPEIIEKINKNASSELDYKGKCTITLLKPGSGNIHIKAARTIQLISSETKGPPLVKILFESTPVVLPLLQFSCPNRRDAPTVFTNEMGNAMFGMMPAYPQLIMFAANGEPEKEQIIYEVGKPGDDLFIKFTVVQWALE